MSEWTDDDGRPLGEWVEISQAEWVALMEAAGGYGALSVFSSLTDPDGVYGPAQVYTAWGRSGDDVPLADIRNLLTAGRTTRKVFRRFDPMPSTAGRFVTIKPPITPEQARILRATPRVEAYTEPRAERPFACVDVTWPDGSRVELTVKPNGDYDEYLVVLAEDTLTRAQAAGQAAIRERWPQ